MHNLRDMTVAPVALLVIRARIEDGSAGPLRVDVRLTADTRHGFEREVRLRDAEAVADFVRRWLTGMAASEAPPAMPEVVTPASRGGHGRSKY